MRPEPGLTRRLWGLHPADVKAALQTLAEEHQTQMEVAHQRVESLKLREATWTLAIARLEEQITSLRQSLEALTQGQELAASYSEHQRQRSSMELADRDRLHQEQLAALQAEQDALRSAIAADQAALVRLAERLVDSLDSHLRSSLEEATASLQAPVTATEG